LLAFKGVKKFESRKKDTGNFWFWTDKVDDWFAGSARLGGLVSELGGVARSAYSHRLPRRSHCCKLNYRSDLFGLATYYCA
jgi:hypothetical protein